MRSVIAEENREPSSFPYMKSQLLKHFGENIIIAEINEKANVVAFLRTASRILHDFYSQKHKDPEQEKAHIIKTAALRIKNDIKTIKQSKDVYPSNAEMTSSEAALENIPDCLKLFMKIVFAGKDVDVKLASIGQAIIQTSRPRIHMAPLQVGLGVQMHHHFQSKFLIESLNSHGCCCSYVQYNVNLANWSQFIHPGPASILTKFFCVESVMRVNADSLLIRAATTSTSGTLNDGPDHGKQQKEEITI